MFLRGMPHLCEKMRRLTNKDTASRKKTEEEPAPDFYALSRLYPLPDATPVPSASRPNAQRQAPSQGILDVETALLERRRADILDRVNLLASSGALRPDALASLSMPQGGLAPNALQQSALQGTQGILRPGMMFDGLGGSSAPAPCPTTLQQLFGARQANPDMAQLLAMNNAGMGMGVGTGMGVGAGMGIGGVSNFVGGGFNM
mmetsp:Transcript_4728/g.10648  ORF Transcript_4728/g.10648 Transcript_4728/m.10648 type:complete len:203 (+) Transcript_4728:687-1295(+)